MGGTDAKDILGLPKTPLSLSHEKKARPQKESHRKPDGISREVSSGLIFQSRAVNIIMSSLLNRRFMRLRVVLRLLCLQLMLPT